MARRTNLQEKRTLDTTTTSPAQTERMGQALGLLARPGDLICLTGPLGAGKTVFARGVAAGLGLKGEDVVSPSFTLIHEYTVAELTYYHVDLYRLPPRAAAELGLEDYLERPAVMVIEWAERLAPALLGERLEIRIAFGETARARRIAFSPQGSRAQELVERLRERLGSAAGD